MGEHLKIRFKEESEEDKKDREKRYRLYKIKNISIFIIVLLFVAFLSYSIFHSFIKSSRNNTRFASIPVIVNSDSEPMIITPDVRSELVADLDRFLGKKEILDATIQGYFGINISEWQLEADWTSFHRSNDTMQIKFIIIKATDGDSVVDTHFMNNWKNAGGNGLNLGAYHLYNHKDDPLMQAENYIKNVYLTKGNLYPIIKVVEKISNSLSADLDETEVLRRLTLFLNRLEQQYGVKPIIFTSYQNFHQFFMGKLDNYKYMLTCYQETPYKRMLSKNINNKIELAPLVYVWQYSFNSELTGFSTSVRKNFIPKEKLDQIVFKHSYDRIN